MPRIDKEMRPHENAVLQVGTLKGFFSEATVIDYGMIVLCQDGEAQIRVNFSEWRLAQGSVITLFPNDVVVLLSMTADFQVEYLKYDASLLREASLQLEQTVYSQLKIDRCRTESPMLQTSSARCSLCFDSTLNKKVVSV